MTLLGILLALALERLLSHSLPLGQPFMLKPLSARAEGGGWYCAPWMPVLLIVLPVLLTAWLDYAIQWPPTQGLLNVIVLVLCLGPRDLADDIRALRRARDSGDTRRAEALSQTLLHDMEDEAGRRNLLGALFVQSHERLFGVLLWFFVLGPAGAVLYRISSRLPRVWHLAQPGGAAEQVAMNLHAAAAWWTGRAFALLFGLSGSLDDALSSWRELARLPRHWRLRTWDIVAIVPSASLASEDRDGDGPSLPTSLDAVLAEVMALQNRALLILLACFAVFTAGGYIA